MINKNNFLADTDWFDKHFTTGFLNEELNVKKFLNEPKYSIADESISSRVLSHWHDAGIIEDTRPEGKGWRKFSFSEVVWISIILKLRKFGLDLKRIKSVKQYLDIFNTKGGASRCPLLDFYIAHCMTSTMPIKLLVFESGDALIGRQVAIDVANQFDFIQEDYISIDLAKLINKRFSGKNIETDYLDYSLTKIEKEVKKGIHFDKVNTLSIKVNQKEEFLLSKEHIRDNQNEIKKLINKIGEYYEETSIKTGNKKHYKLTEKKKIKK